MNIENNFESRLRNQSFLLGLLLFAVITIAILTGCSSATVKLTNDGQEVVMDEAFGSMTPERYTAYKKQHSRQLTLDALEKQLAQAAFDKDWLLVEKLRDLIQDLELNSSSYGNYNSPARTVAGKMIKLGILNNSKDYNITIVGGPFDGTSLTPGEATKDKRPFQKGNYELKYKSYKIGERGYSLIVDNVAITETRDWPITIGQGR